MNYDETNMNQLVYHKFTLFSHWHTRTHPKVPLMSFYSIGGARFHYIKSKRPQHPEFSSNFKITWHTAF